MVLIHSGTPSWSVRMSVYSVPVTLTTTTVSQYGNGHVPAAAAAGRPGPPRSTAVKMQAVFTRPTPSVMLIQSAKLSPTVVQRILITQNQMVTSGTLFSISRPLRCVRASLVVVMRRAWLGQPAHNLTT